MERTPTRQAATIGGILGLVGAAVRLAGSIYWLSPRDIGFRNWLGDLAWPLLVAFFSALILAAGRSWSLLGAGGLLSLGLYSIWAFVPTVIDFLVKPEPPWWDRYRWDFASILVAGGIVVVGGIVAFLGRDREQESRFVNVIADSPVDGS